MEKITIKTTVKADIKKAWDTWNKPEHITKWCFASEDWHCPKSENDLKVGGAFSSRMEAKDGSFGFDFGGTYDEVKMHSRIAYSMDDGRKVEIDFKQNGHETEIIESFDPESENPIEMQKNGWQAILNNYKAYTESI